MNNRWSSINRILVISAVILTAGLVVQVVRGVNRLQHHGKYMMLPAFEPQTLAEADRLADQVVVGQVVSLRRGADLVSKAPGEPGDVDRIPTEIVTLKIDKTMKGPAAQSVEVFRTGLSVDPLFDRPIPKTPPDTAERPKDAVGDPSKLPRPTREQANRYSVHDDPPYQVGQRYLLMLTKGPEMAKGARRLVSPEGRFFVGADNRLIPASQRAFAPQMRGRALTDIEGELLKLRPPVKLQPGLQPVPQVPGQPKLPPGTPGGVPQTPPR
ncbi:MAG: hypothetical protein ACREJ4_08775 [Candidatus Methylomirabilaceae bacterium]